MFEVDNCENSNDQILISKWKKEFLKIKTLEIKNPKNEMEYDKCDTNHFVWQNGDVHLV